eukprot:c19051_g1_i1.p1 GENE.c19051_g1_i1~~c19051_g1_i1.p1  ORF type:complete len:112 (+),score=29.24 c19051_g1_i1:64-399(+)
MKHVAAYLLAVLGGNESPSAKDVQEILSSVGIEAESDRLNKLVSELKGKNVHEVIAAGRTKLQSLPSGGSAAPAAASAAPAAGAGKSEAKKEEPKKKEEEPDEDMGFSLFD